MANQLDLNWEEVVYLEWASHVLTSTLKMGTD
jgi:hypothetical protein